MFSNSCMKNKFIGKIDNKNTMSCKKKKEN